MSEITTIHEEFIKQSEQIKFNKAQQKTIECLMEKNKELIIQINHLQTLLKSTPLICPIEVVIKSPEEELVDTQISLLNLRGANIEMTLEEVKKLDLLIKNKNLIKEQSALIQAEPKKISKKNLTNAELIHIATAKKDTADGSEA